MEIVKSCGPISGEEIAARLHLSRAALRPHLAVLTMSGLVEARPRVGYYFSGNEKKSMLAGFFSRYKVRDIYSVPVVVRENTSVYDAIVTLFLEDVGTLFVIDKDGYLQGVVSRKDLLKTSIGTSDLSRIPVAVIMTRAPGLVTVDQDEDVLSAAKKIVDYQVDALPVVKELAGGKLKIVGKVTKTTLVRLLVEVNS